MRDKTKKHHRIFKILLQKLKADDDNYDAEDLYVLVSLAQEWRLDFAALAAEAGVSDMLEDVPSVRPIGPPPPMPKPSIVSDLADVDDFDTP